MKLKGTIVLESLNDDRILNEVEVSHFRVTKEETSDERWHMFTVRADEGTVARLAGFLKPGWYAHFWNGDDVVAVFQGQTFNFKYSDRSTWKEAVEYGKSLGIPEEQLDFLIEE